MVNLKFILIVLLIFYSKVYFAQQTDQKQDKKDFKMPATGHIFGKIVDSKTNEAVPFASVALFKKDSVIAGKFAGTNGEFSLENLPSGKFNLKITFLGYKTFEQLITITPKTDEQDLGNIKLDIEETLLKSVEVVAEKSVVEMSIDRKVFNVDKNLTSKGGTATDVMKNIPSVTIDADGNVQLRQNSTTIYVDGRPTTLTLDMIPADQIDKVEIITNPSAKFDAGTTGGIINIVMKSNIKPGYNGIVTGGIGTNNRYNGMVSLNVKQKPIGFSITYNYNTYKNLVLGYTNKTSLFSNSPTGYYNVNDKLTLHNTFQSGSATFDYYINNHNTISLSESIAIGEFDNNDKQLFNSKNASDSILNNGNRTTNSYIHFQNYTTKLQYKKTFIKKGRELTADMNFNDHINNNPSDFTTNTYAGNTNIFLADNPKLQNNTAKNINQMYTLQSDYVNPINDSTKLELGLRSNYKPSSQLLQVNEFDYTINNYSTNQYLSNQYKTVALINAAYINYSTKYKKISYMIGFRFEQSYYKTTLTNKNDSSFQYSYPSTINNLKNALFPSIFVSKKFNIKQEIQFNITRKINRPNGRQFLPFIWSSDAKNYNIGNPYLTPEFINMAELNFNQLIKKGNLMFSLFFRNTQNPLTNYSYPIASDSSILMHTTINGNQSNTIGLDNTFKYTLFKGFETTLNMNLFYTIINAKYNNQNFSNQGFNYTSKINFIYRLPQNYSMQLSGNYMSPKVIPQGTTIQNYFIDFAVSKEIRKFITLTGSVSDIFNTKGSGTNYITNQYLQNTWGRRESRYFKFTAMIRFGKADASMFKKRQSTPLQNDSDGGF